MFNFYCAEYGNDGDGDISAIALFAFALVEKDRMEWIEHMRETTGTSPSSTDIEAWFRAKPRQYFDERGNAAFGWFTGFARALLADEMSVDRKHAVSEALGNLGKFWPSFWVGNFVGITSNIIFTMLVVLFVVVVSSDFSFISWSKKIFGYN